MGLDMYLYRAPRYDGVAPTQINDMQGYFDWLESKANPKSAARRCTLKAWCDVDFRKLPKKVIRDFYKQYYTKKYWLWDEEKRYGHNMIFEHVGDWRKVNAVHGWFVEHVQNGTDDCNYYQVSKDALEELLQTCKDVKTHIYEDAYGDMRVTYEYAEEFLPTCSGFFFGDTAYDGWYIRGLNKTIEIVENVLNSTDFDTQMIIYHSSW